MDYIFETVKDFLHEAIWGQDCVVLLMTPNSEWMMEASTVKNEAIELNTFRVNYEDIKTQELKNYLNNTFDLFVADPQIQWLAHKSHLLALVLLTRENEHHLLKSQTSTFVQGAIREDDEGNLRCQDHRILCDVPVRKTLLSANSERMNFFQ